MAPQDLGPRPRPAAVARILRTVSSAPGLHRRRSELPPGSGEGEADLVAWERDTLAVVEVKSRETANTARRSAPSARETRPHARVAREYAARSGTPWEQVRFDVVTVLLTKPPRSLCTAGFDTLPCAARIPGRTKLASSNHVCRPEGVMPARVSYGS